MTRRHVIDRGTAPGEMENRIKEQQLCLFADLVSTSWLWSNHLRQWFAMLAHVVLHVLRTIGLTDTDHARPGAAPLAPTCSR